MSKPQQKPLNIVQLNQAIARNKFSIEGLVDFLDESEYWTDEEMADAMRSWKKDDARKLAASIRDEHGWRILESVEYEDRHGVRHRAYIAETNWTPEMYEQVVAAKMKAGILLIKRARQLEANFRERYPDQPRLPGIEAAIQ